WRLCLAR
ncbi:amino acid permease family protein, partial [Vibrio parahaemolyticus V-223/04]